MRKNKLYILMLFFILADANSAIKPMTDDEIKKIIVEGNLKSFEGECPCPYSKDSEGKECGDTSEYFRTRGKVFCYLEDISLSDVNAYRQRYGIDDPKGVLLRK